jgi:hypothetical protein
MPMPREIKDSSFKMILDDHELFVQFLHDFVKLEGFPRCLD